MKNKKGFTLIELLAVIIVLAIIAVITVPIILKVFENSKEGAAKDSAYGYKEAINKFYLKTSASDEDFELEGTYEINSDGSISNEDNNYQIKVNGTIPKGGYLVINKGYAKQGCVQIEEYAVTLEDGLVTKAEKKTCLDPNAPIIVDEFPQIEDQNPGAICGTGSTEDYENNDICYINSVEDLVEFSNLVNSGKNFSEKTVILLNGLDLQSDKSYSNPNANAFGDINGNGTSSTSLKEELTDTTGKGFKQIGNNNNRFAGTFKGNAHIIKNLFINRASETYVGLFGYNEGTIEELELKNATINATGTAGLLVGRNTGTLKNIIVEGNATISSNVVGLVCGYNYNRVEHVVAKGNVTGDRHVGGVIGWNNSGVITAAYVGGTINVLSNYTNLGGRIYGAFDGYNPTMSAIALSTVQINTTDVINEGFTSRDGLSISENGLKSIAAYDLILDTYIGGDNDEDGYYFDFDTEDNIKLYRTSDRPLRITMKGSGTASSPYLIKKYEDLKQVAYEPNKYYQLTIDIDFNNKKQWMLASSTIPFSGTFDGQNHKLKNVHLEGTNYLGLFGKNTGTIKNIEFETPNLKGNDYVGIVTGHNNGTIKDIKITNLTATVRYYGGGIVGYNDSSTGLINGIWITGNITGNHTTGLIAGYNNQGTIREAIIEGNATVSSNKVGLACGYNHGTVEKVVAKGNVTGDRHVGGIIGWTNSGTIKAAYIGGHISVLSGYDNLGGRINGAYDGSYPVRSSIALDTITINETVPSSTGLTSANGQSYTATELQTPTPYANLPLNFTDTTAEYIWSFENNNITLNKN